MDIVDVDARSVIGNTWQRCESTFSHRNVESVASDASGHSLVTVLTRNKRIVPVCIPTDMKLAPRAATPDHKKK